MKCPNKITLTQYVDNELPEHLRNHIDTHLLSCPKCRELLEEIKAEIELTAAKLELLKPGEIPGNIFIPSSTKAPAAKPGIIPGIKNMLKSSVRVPVPTFAVLAAVIVFMAVGLVIQDNKIAELKSPLLAAKKQPTLYMVSESKIQSVSLESDLTGFQPIAKPRVFVVKENKNEKNPI